MVTSAGSALAAVAFATMAASEGLWLFHIACLLPMIETLPETYRNAVLWSEIDSLPQREVAERLGISLSGAKSRVQRRREKLRAIVLDCCHVEPARRRRPGLQAETGWGAVLLKFGVDARRASPHLPMGAGRARHNRRIGTDRTAISVRMPMALFGKITFVERSVIGG